MAAQISETPLVVFITGCSNGGIGSALTAEFVRNGCLVYASARSLASMSELGEDIRKLEVDVTNHASCEKAVEMIYAEAGRVDIFVSNAGVASVGALLDVSLETAQKVMDINFYGTLRLVHLIGPRMGRRGKGLIVTMGSTSGELPIPFAGLYNSSKAALHAYTETLAEECRPLGVNVMLCVPGTVVSNIAKNEAKIYERNIPDDSLYIGYKAKMNEILFFGQKNGPMPTEKFAKGVVKTTLSAHPPTYMTYGSTTTLWAFLKWLPRATAIRMIWNNVVGK